MVSIIDIKRYHFSALAFNIDCPSHNYFPVMNSLDLSTSIDG